MEWITKAIDFFIDAKRKLSHRMIVGFAIVASLFLLNNIFGVTYYYRVNRKVEQIAQINTLLKDHALDDSTRQFLLKQKQATINRQDLLQKAMNLFNPSSVKRDTIYVTEVKGEKVYSNNRAFEVTKDKFWHFITSNYLFLVVALIIPFLPNRTNDGFLWHIASIILIEALLYVTMLFYAWLLNFIPVLFGDPLWNYIINAIVNTLLGGMFLLGLYNSEQEEREEQEKRKERIKSELPING